MAFKFNWVWAGGSVFFFASAAPAQKRPAMIDFQPGGKWTVDYAANLCVLGRDMVAGNRRLRFSVRPSVNATDAMIAITEPTAKSRRIEGYPFVRFGDGTRVYASGQRMWKDGIQWTIIHLMREDLDLLERPDPSVEIWFGDQYYRLFPGDMTKADQALAACERDLLKLMGMSEAEQDRLATPPTYPKESILRSSDYPDVLLSKDIEARMGLLLDIGADGRVKSCTAMESSGIPAFDTYACDIFRKRGRYGPALDKDGKPMRTLTYQRVRWMIETNLWGKPYKDPRRKDRK